MKKTLCPFSKPIIGNWCRCKHANLDERCGGKMTCLMAEDYLEGCYALVELFKQRSRFVLGITNEQDALTHQQLMKIRCGGLLGMQRLLQQQEAVPDVLDIMQLAREVYGDVESFPFSDIVPDIQNFSHRKRRRKNRDDPN